MSDILFVLLVLFVPTILALVLTARLSNLGLRLILSLIVSLTLYSLITGFADQWTVFFFGSIDCYLPWNLVCSDDFFSGLAAAIFGFVLVFFFTTVPVVVHDLLKTGERLGNIFTIPVMVSIFKKAVRVGFIAASLMLLIYLYERYNEALVGGVLIAVLIVLGVKMIPHDNRSGFSFRRVGGIILIAMALLLLFVFYSLFTAPSL